MQEEIRERNRGCEAKRKKGGNENRRMYKGRNKGMYENLKGLTGLREGERRKREREIERGRREQGNAIYI